MSLALERLASEVGASERTLRRGAASQLIRAPRRDSRGIFLTDQETSWIRRHWTLVGALRRALRTEPNVELVVLFGSVARGDDIAGVSDLDLLVGLRKPAPGALEALRLRLRRRLALEVQLIPVEAAHRNPRLLEEILRDGRPVIDRARAWPRLQAKARSLSGAIDRQERELRVDALTALDYFQELAALRARSPLDAGS